RMPRINGPRDAGVGAANVAGLDVAPATVPEQRCIPREHPLLLGEPGSDLVTRRAQGNEAVLLFSSARARSKNAGELRVPDSAESRGVRVGSSAERVVRAQAAYPVGALDADPPRVGVTRRGETQQVDVRVLVIGHGGH